MSKISKAQHNALMGIEVDYDHAHTILHWNEISELHRTVVALDRLGYIGRLCIEFPGGRTCTSYYYLTQKGEEYQMQAREQRPSATRR
jgi:hypothetical protein